MLLEQLPRVHSEALIAARSNHSDRSWALLTECYVADLRIAPELLREPANPSLHQALVLGYEATVPALLQLARQMGFPGVDLVTHVCHFGQL